MDQNLNYYELLDIKADASADQIKRAYFGKVRTYPPERFPEEFKKIRSAYEILSDPKSREHYDNRFGKSPIDILFDEAREAYENGDYEEAITICEKIYKTDPDFDAVINIIGLSHIELEQYDQAVAAYKRIRHKSQGESSFFHNYGAALYYSGAIRQAIEALSKAVELECDSVQTWIYLSNCYCAKNEYEKARAVILRSLDYCGETVSAYIHLIHIDIDMGNIDYIKKDVNLLEKYAKKDPEMSENVAWSLSELAEEIIYRMPESSDEILKRAKRLMPKGNSELNSLQKEIKKEKFLKDQYDLLKKDVLVHVWIKDIIHDRCFAQLSIFMDNDFSITERVLLRKPQNVLSSVERIKTHYPALYKEVKYFFDIILSNPDGYKINEAELIEDINEAEEERSSQHRMRSLDDIFVPNMQVINTNKTGRNDPCPCGSGRKYKKCCMS